MTSIPPIFLSHGSPMIALDTSPAHDFLEGLQSFTGRPDFILVVSAHWETHGLKVTGSPTPKTIHDFGGFDPRLHQMIYPAAGDPQLAAHIQHTLGKAGIPMLIDPLRGLDHGAWIPLILAFPEADIPVLQISIPKGSTPHELYDIGKALTPILGERGLLIGSGSLTHNLYEFKGQDLNDIPEPWVREFAEWMNAKIAVGDVDGLLNYRTLAPYAKENHPTEEHLLPLFAALGAGMGHSETVQSATLHRSYNHSILAMDAYSFEAE